MARYENLKDYIQKVHLELIRNTISDFLISELHDDRYIRNTIVRSDYARGHVDIPII